MLTIRATFNVFGYQCREVDLTPVIGASLIALVILLVGHNTMIGG